MKALRLKTGTVRPENVQVFDSVSAFQHYILSTPTSRIFTGKTLQSKATDVRHVSRSQTASFDEALDLLVHGSTDLSERMTKSYNISVNSLGEKKVNKAYFDVMGYQASVPRYLQGIPTSMVNSKRVESKQKIITVVKSISYNWGWNPEEIIEESVKALAIVKKLESQGYRVNIDIMVMVGDSYQNIFVLKVRIKHANERMNIGKMAFTLAHPAMLRRICLRWMEVNPSITDIEVTDGYGKPRQPEDFFFKNEHGYVIPAMIDDADKVIRKWGLK